jgi:transposase
VFLQELLWHLRGPVIVLLDNSTTHKGEPLEKLRQKHPRLTIEHFPSYAPQRNPDEGVWSLAKQDLANSCPKDVEELMEDVIRSINAIRTSPEKLCGCILQSELPVFFALVYSIIYAEICNKEAGAELLGADKIFFRTGSHTSRKTKLTG